jgi:hypothetical protein
MHIKKIIAVILVFLQITLIATGCGSTNAEADTYISMAQEFIDKGDYESALKILQQGFEATEDSQIAVLMAKLTSATESTTNTEKPTVSTEFTQPTQSTVPNEDTFDLSPFAGIWSEEGFGWLYGGMMLEISPQNEHFSITIYYYQGAPTSRRADVCIEITDSDIIDGTFSASFEDSWCNTGTMTIQFESDRIVCQITNMNNSEDAMWGMSDGWFSLYPNQNAFESLNYTMEEYYAEFPEYDSGNQEPTYTTSKASDILAGMGISEEDFRLHCQPLKRDIASNDSLIINDLRDYPAMYTNELFTFVDTLNKPLSVRVSAKGVSSDGYTTYIIYPNQEWQGNILLFDMRDDIYYPTISIGDHIYPYMIYTGIQTINGYDYVCFLLISVDKK